ncbi:hypothetical protein ABFS83_11G019500 [Erythranthe nasuta]
MILRGLAYMHAVAGVFHGDLKPQNEMVDPLNSSGENMRLRKRTIVRVEGNISYVCLRFELLLGQVSNSIIIYAVTKALAFLLFSVYYILCSYVFGLTLKYKLRSQSPGENSADKSQGFHYH